MSKKNFSNKDVMKLSKNKYVLKVSEKAITYTNEFKIHFIAEYSKGKSSRLIFHEAGFDTNVVGKRRIDSFSNRWRTAFKENGVIGLNDARKNHSGRPRTRELTQEEMIAKKDAEIEYLRAEVELLKKLELIERQVKNTKLVSSEAFKIIEIIIKRFNLSNMISHLCNIAGVSRSGYYNYITSINARKQQEDNDIEARDIILMAFDHRGYKKGSRSIKMTLENEFNLTFNRKRIQRIMRKYNIICPHRKPSPYKRIAKATKEHSVVPNLLNRNFKQEIPGKVLLTDITYLPYNRTDMAYLSTIKDASTNEILAYHLSDRITLDIATNTIHKLINNKNFKLLSDTFIHSDQGSHYTSPTFQKLLRKYKLGQSMSRRGNCWDNAPQESFFGHMKDEIDYKCCSTLGELKSVIDNYMNYYNNYRCQWNLKKLTPVQYRNQLLAS